ncbi:hypothetical protein [Streptomyces sp. A5-4]|uniref:hypothetical protein n=1 Tax=Streptomyces sp. A5-4 TaxID=3384771 RepID=UPI003DA8613D
MEIPEPTGLPYINPDHNDVTRPVCGFCPSTVYPREQFVIYSRPSWECPVNPVDGRRYTRDDVAVPACVHPDKIGLGPDRIAPPPQPEQVESQPSDVPSRRGWWKLSWRSR